MQIYGDARSGNCYKILLLAAMLKLDYQWQPVDILAGDTKQDTFLALNPNGKIPVLVLDDGRCLAESNAILHYLAAGRAYLPTDAYQLAKVLEWQFFEQYSHEPYIAVARFIAKYLGMPKSRQVEFQQKQAGGHKALKVMEQQLEKTPYLIGDKFTIADISLYGYTHVAPEGGFDLSRYPAIRDWLGRIKNLPGYVAMETLQNSPI